MNPSHHLDLDASAAARAPAQVPVKHPLFQHPVLGGIADQIIGSHLGGALFEEDDAAVAAAEDRQMIDDGHHK